MKLVFTKGKKKDDHLTILVDPDKPDNAQIIACPKQRILPHDMIHYVIESIVPFPGFLFRLYNREAVSFNMDAAEEFEPVERLVEVLQGLKWSGNEGDWDAFREMYHLTCQARGHAIIDITEEHYHQMLQLYQTLDERWQELETSESLSLLYEPPMAT